MFYFCTLFPLEYIYTTLNTSDITSNTQPPCHLCNCDRVKHVAYRFCRYACVAVSKKKVHLRGSSHSLFIAI